MATEKLANNASTTLNGNINNSTTSVVVTSASGFPTSGNFRILIGNEILLVTAVSGTTFTVATRGSIESTGAASHATGSQVTHILTAGALAQYVSENAAPGGPTTTMVDTDFTNENSSGNAALANFSGGIKLTINSSETGQHQRVWSRTFPANSVTAAFKFCGMSTGTGYCHLSFGFFDPTGGALVLLEFYTHAGTTPFRLALNHYTSVNAGTNSIKAWTLTDNDILWFKAAIISGDLYFYVSPDGTNWIQVYTEGATSSLANSPTKIVWGGTMWPDASTDPGLIIKLLSWTEA